MTKRSADRSPGSDLSRVVGQATAATDKLYKLGLPHPLVAPSFATESLATVVDNLGIDYSRLVPDYSEMFADSLELFRWATKGPFEQWFSSIDRLTEAFNRIASTTKLRWLFPPNWDGVDEPSLDLLDKIILDEGIPVAWIPRASVIQALLAAKDANARRKILSRRWSSIADDCSRVLHEISHRQLENHANVAKKVSAALKAGHTEASQALAANLLDSVLRKHFAANARREVTNHKNGNRLDIGTYTFHAGLVLAPIWRAYAEFWHHNGDPIPRVFTRHASAHAVSRRQYSRVNAVVALMLVTSVIKFLDEHSK